MSAQEQPLLLCEIIIRRTLTPGDDDLAIILPEEDEASLIEVLGMLDLARDTAIRARMGEA